ncbi:hypothetical protein AB852_27260 [Streptomyces uncialis]|uniref:Uncharacterized protein n=1 Tax=Streptomyces uncialis TaxID=1048205 RepID=A0A1Q4V2A3_9ACTN|nr:hypothetical protein AB852_27260 [Streptomyces uncialis]
MIVTVFGLVHLTFLACMFVMLTGDFFSLKNVMECVMCDDSSFAPIESRYLLAARLSTRLWRSLGPNAASFRLSSSVSRRSSTYIGQSPGSSSLIRMTKGGVVFSLESSSFFSADFCARTAGSVSQTSMAAATNTPARAAAIP